MSAYTAIFLSNKYPFKRLLVLKRAEWKKFAPLMYTGVGGKGENKESPLECAIRELEEETGLRDIKLIEFARIIYGNRSLHYFWGKVRGKKMPECNEGDLEWAEASEKIIEINFIPSTKLLFSEWFKRGFLIDKPWTMWMSGKADAITGVTLNPSIDNFKEGLW